MSISISTAILIPACCIMLVLTSVFAKENVIIIVGDDSRSRYYDISKYAYKSYSSATHSVFIATPKPYGASASRSGIHKFENSLTDSLTTIRKRKWNFAPKKQYLRFESKSKILQTISKKFKTGGTLFINDHGGPPTISGEIMSATIQHVKKESFSIKELQNALKSSRGYNKLIGIQCFSGSLHHISFKLPKTCSMTSSNWAKSSFTIGRMSKYAQGIYLEKKRLDKEYDFNNDGMTSMLEAHIAGIAIDNENSENNISSMAYINYILKEEDYSSEFINYHFQPSNNLPLKGKKFPSETTSNERDTIICLQSNNNSKLLRLYKDVTTILTNSLSKFHLTSNERNSLPEKLKKTHDRLLEKLGNHIESNKNNYFHIRKKYQHLNNIYDTALNNREKYPPPLKYLHKNKLDLQKQLKKNISNSKDLVKNLKNKLIEIENAIKIVKKNAPLIAKLDKKLKEAAIARNTFTINSRKHVRNIILSQWPPRNIRKYFKFLKKYPRFLDATKNNPEARKKFLALLECEEQAI